MFFESQASIYTYLAPFRKKLKNLYHADVALSRNKKKLNVDQLRDEITNFIEKKLIKQAKENLKEYRFLKQEANVSVLESPHGDKLRITLSAGELKEFE